ncbi:FAD-dependent oxidoreductase [Azohydromonas sp. G-1-1-14]|uniref:FAD-dependent oxidoreductase n=2 Tax=Azohydromonas caseinilytica TaxID=2728836 RepID=A0A848FEZ4_9BURK|nr:FAD-dependent oxidoreductase [Azohydromonas caseinilytica]
MGRSGAGVPAALVPHGSVGAEAVPTHCDLLVIGSGAGGLSTAVTAASLGLQVLVVEKEAVLGGTTAWSGGWMWIPRNPLAVQAGIREPLQAPREYLRHELGAQYDAARIDAFLVQGPRMVEFFRSSTALDFIDGNAVPDFHGHSPGAATGGRSVCAAPFDARALGPALAYLRRPLDLISFWGMGIAASELRHFFNAMRSAGAFGYVARRVAAHVKDLLLHRRGMRLVAGNALVGGLLKSALDRGVQLRVSSPVRRLLTEGGRVTGAVVKTAQGDVTVHARRGVVLACGGFPHDPARRQALLGDPAAAAAHWSAAPSSNTGDGLRLGEGAGGVVDDTLASPIAWAPVSLVPRGDGSTGHFPHLVERAKPGVIAVRANGERFTNEADSYHDVMSALVRATPAGDAVQAWLICDHRFIRRYGLGRVRPAPVPMRPWLQRGYLKRGASLQALAQACGIDAAALQATVERFNADARQGRDGAFHRGDTPYNRVQGEAAQQPNPCVAPIEHGPFYAVRIVPGSLGTFAGLRTDAAARVLDARGAPIPGLWAAGNDMSSVLGGHYPSGGITLGPAMTFGFIAAHDAAQARLSAAALAPAAVAAT